MAEVICRHAKDDFEALMTASGMENAGAEVFSITWTGRGLDSVMAYAVFAKYSEPVTPDAIDKNIRAVLYHNGDDA